MLASSATASASDVERERERLSVEVSGRHDVALLEQDERVVRRGVQLDRDGRLDIVEQVTTGTVHLRRAADRVRVLHLVAPAVGLDDRGALEELPDVGRRVLLPAQGTRTMHLDPEARARSLQSLERQGAGQIGALREPAGADRPERGHRGHELRPVHEREPLLAHEPDGLEPDPRERAGAVETLSGDDGLALPHERERQVSERRKVSARANRAARGDDREHASVQAGEEQLGGLDPGSRVPLRERVYPQEHRGPNHVVRIRLAHPARVAPKQTELQLARKLLRDVLRDEAPEAGVDAVGVLPLDRIDELARSAHSLSSAIGQLGLRSLHGDVPDVRQRQVVARQLDRLRHGSESSSG